MQKIKIRPWLHTNFDELAVVGSDSDYYYLLLKNSLLGPVFIRTALPCSGGYHMERGGMPLHNAVGINCKKGATTENQGSGVK